MTPYFLLSVLISGAYGAAFHVWRGKTLKDIPYYLVASVIGFMLGQFIGYMLGWRFFALGEIHIIHASLGSILVLSIANWLKIES